MITNSAESSASHSATSTLSEQSATSQSPSREERRKKSERSTESPYPTASRGLRSRLTERSRETHGSQSQAAHQLPTSLKRSPIYHNTSCQSISHAFLEPTFSMTKTPNHYHKLLYYTITQASIN